MKVLIVEDEPLLAKQLKTLITSLEPAAVITGMLNSVSATVHYLETNPAPDLIFMDIELADGQCFQIFQQVKVKTPVIFTTAYDEYALQAFKVNSIDYLLKPIDTTALKSALEKYKELHKANATVNMDLLISQLQQARPANTYRDRFLVKQGKKMISLPVEDIAFFSARNTLNFITTKEKQKFIVELTLDEIEDSINPRQFFRINRQYIIANDVVTAIHPWFNGKLKLDSNIQAEEDLVISREKAPLFKAWMGG
jgi:two-component system, LytTR family, response regulator LytT